MNLKAVCSKLANGFYLALNNQKDNQMPSQKPLSQKNSQKVLSFAALLIIGLCLSVFTAASSAQQTTSIDRVIVNGNTRTANVAPTPEPPKSIVRGRVVYEDTGRPVRRTEVTLIGVQSGGGKSAITGSHGEFELLNVAEGKYSLMIDSPDILNLFSRSGSSEDPVSYDVGKTDDELASITRSEEEIIIPNISTTVDVFIRVKRGGALSGRILYADGDPAINLTVEALPKKELSHHGLIKNANSYNGASNLKVKTDDRGIYRIVGLQPGEYVVRASEAALHRDDTESGKGAGGTFSSLLTTFYPDSTEITKAAVLKLTLGQEISEINITLPERAVYKVKGRIVAQKTQQTIKGAGISIRRKSEEVDVNFAEISESNNFYTDETGGFGFKDLPAGIYKIKVSPPNYWNEYDENGNPKPGVVMTKFAPTEKEITIDNKDLVNLVIEMSLGGSVAGSVTTDDNKPLSGMIYIFFRSADSENHLSTTTSGYYGKEPLRKADFKLELIPAGKFQMSAYILDEDEENKKKDRPAYYVKSIKRAGKDLLAAPLELGDGENITDVQIILATDGGTLAGKIRRKNSDKPAVNQVMCLVPVDESNWLSTWLWKCGATGLDGKYELKFAPGNYFIMLYTNEDLTQKHGKDFTEKYTDTEKQRAWIRERIGNAEKITIKPNETTTTDLIAP